MLASSGPFNEASKMLRCALHDRLSTFCDFLNNSIIKSKKNSFITAASTPEQQPFGFVFLNCKLTADTALAKKVHLGWPWRPNAKVVYLNTEMGAHITPAGWDNWKNPANEKTAYFAEYRSTGPGAVGIPAHGEGSKAVHAEGHFRGRGAVAAVKN
ncbi:pectinesterase family protein [Hymenobacter siberiensis]|uniref:pectinesterase family protein n=1 Tax=Hymenobacter siberiensis TaxID=2848396 RepID=UPI001F20ADA9|nr:pectinesterase family protein [Hymenobacter siberiensis]